MSGHESCISCVIKTVVSSQTCPAPLQDHMARSSTASDLKSTLKPRLYSHLTCFKSSWTKTPIYPSVSSAASSFLQIQLNLFMSHRYLPFLFFRDFSCIVSVWSCSAAWTQPRHAKSPLCPFNKGRFTGSRNLSCTGCYCKLWHISLFHLLFLKWDSVEGFTHFPNLYCFVFSKSLIFHDCVKSDSYFL